MDKEIFSVDKLIFRRRNLFIFLFLLVINLIILLPSIYIHHNPNLDYLVGRFYRRYSELILWVAAIFSLLVFLFIFAGAIQLLLVTESSSERPRDEPRMAIRLLKLILPADQVQHVTGDLLEEFGLFESRSKARIWLYKQVLWSVLPLVFNNLKSRLASYFGRGAQ